MQTSAPAPVPAMPAAAPAARRLITVLIPVMNEEPGLATLVERLTPILDQLGHDWELLFVDDGSTDGTLNLIKALQRTEPRLRAISLSRNFGKEIALAAGLAHARGEAAIIMDADLQHPPEVLPRMVELWGQGYQVVYGQRQDRETDGFLRRQFSRAFYRVFNVLVRTDIPEGAGDFRLLDRKAIDAMNQLKECSRFNKGLFSWIGFKSIGVPFTVGERQHGTTKWSFRKLLRFAIDGLTSFSTLPLRVWSLVGALISLIAFVYAVAILTNTLIFGSVVPGFPTLVISVMMLSGVQLISLGVLGEYLGRVYEEVKRRPLYIIAEEIGAPPTSAARSQREPSPGEPRA